MPPPSSLPEADTGPTVYPTTPGATEAWDDLTPLDPNGTRITDHWVAVRRERPDTLTAASRGWSDFAVQLDDLAVRLGRLASTLGERWNSQAADAFQLEVGNTTRSLGEWKAIADANSEALSKLAEDVTSLKAAMDRLYQEYQDEMARLEAEE